jgi:hypothetical protein
MTLGPPIPIRHGRRGIAAAGYTWAALGPMSPASTAAMPDAIAVLIAADAAPDGMPSGPGWRVERRTRRRVLVVCDPGGWRAHEG